MKMKRLLNVTAVLIMLSSCGNDWPKEDQSAFMETCVRDSGGRTSACKCVLKKLMNAHAAKDGFIPEDKIKKDVKECLKEM
ncbi:hypothetical protein [Sulfurimonas sp.]|uniref:hypothetical protein n=1 Tax=Sulfurimonas sp. TaxID=2022749 RepID=UPI00356736A1